MLHDPKDSEATVEGLADIKFRRMPCLVFFVNLVEMRTPRALMLEKLLGPVAEYIGRMAFAATGVTENFVCREGETPRDMEQRVRLLKADLDSEWFKLLQYCQAFLRCFRAADQDCDSIRLQVLETLHSLKFQVHFILTFLNSRMLQRLIEVSSNADSSEPYSRFHEILADLDRSVDSKDALAFMEQHVDVEDLRLAGFRYDPHYAFRREDEKPKERSEVDGNSMARARPFADSVDSAVKALISKCVAARGREESKRPARGGRGKTRGKRGSKSDR